LENTGADLIFRNGEDGGAVAKVVWPRNAFASPAGAEPQIVKQRTNKKQARKSDNDRIRLDRSSLRRLWHRIFGGPGG
jgi:hypothetical protein